MKTPPPNDNDGVWYTILYLGFGIGLGVLIGNLLFKAMISNATQNYDNPISCQQAGGYYRRLATGERYVCYLPVRKSP
jgi:hypothetical protein